MVEPKLLYLSLDAVQPSEPQDLPSTQFTLCMVNLILILRIVLINDFILV